MSVESITWLHLSDWHQKVVKSTRDRHERRHVVIQILRDIKRALVRRQIDKLDLIVFSGDIAFSGLQAEYEDAEKLLLEPLLRFTKVPKKRCIFVAGNHDVERAQIQFLPSSMQKPQGPLVFDTITTDALTENPGTIRQLRQPFANFKSFAHPFHPDADWANSTQPLPSVGGVTVEFYALNTALYCGRQDVHGKTQDYGGLFVGSGQQRVLPGTTAPRLDLAVNTLRIAVLHHPFSWLYQAEQARLQEELYDKMHFILVGHEHNQRVEEVVSCYGDVVIIPAGPTFDQHALSATTTDRYGMAYNIVRLNIDAGPQLVSGWTWLRRWDSRNRRFVQDARYPTVPNGVYPLRSIGTPPPSFWSLPSGSLGTI